MASTATTSSVLSSPTTGTGSTSIPTSASSSPATTTTPATPIFSDDAPKPSQTLASSTSGSASASATGSSGQTSTVGLINYYFIFFALILCVAALGAFYLFRRRRRAILNFHNGRSDALERDVYTWDPMRGRRRQWQSRWRSADVSREEGLNEEGEAPPPYVPKSDDEAGHPGNGDATPAGPVIPLQTLSREAAGLHSQKPPDYEDHVRQVGHEHRRRSSATSEPNSSRNP